uniref:Uncharacterized protein n=1 Tax=Strongyloides papillosus TaxID=174720 RepID=A0A0N5CGC0_STREA
MLDEEENDIFDESTKYKHDPASYELTKYISLSLCTPYINDVLNLFVDYEDQNDMNNGDPVSDFLPIINLLNMVFN